MKIFYQTGEVYDDNGRFIGYKGKNLHSKETKFFTPFNSKNEFDPTTLYNFSPFSSNDDKSENDYCYKKTRDDIITGKIIEYATRSIISHVENHYNYNLNRGLPVNCLNFNSNDINLEFDEDMEAYGYYKPLGNILGIILEKSRRLKLNDKIKKEIDDTCCHEIGHIKAAEITIDQKKMLLKARVGFYYVIYEIEEHKVENGDIFYKVLDPIKEKEYYLKEILEEIINDTECIEVNPNYTIYFLDYGKLINGLCDNKLNLARYNEGIDKYYECMTDIMPSENRAKEVLELIEAARKDESFFHKDRRDALRLIREYQKRKSRLL